MDDSKMHKLNGVIEHYKRHISRATESNDNDKIMKCITKLSRLPITVQNLQNTGIGRVVNNLRKYDGNIGESAKSLVIQWKNVVKIEETENFYNREENSDEEHHDVSSPKDNEEFINESEVINSMKDDSSDHESSYRRHHEKSKHKKSKKDKDSKKRKESYSNSTDDQEDGHVSKKVKKDYKYESVKVKEEPERCEIAQNVATTSHRENTNGYAESIKKEKKSSHSEKKKDKHKSSHKSESKSHSHKDKNESKSGHKDKSDSKKSTKDKTKEESKPSTSANHSSNSKTFEEALLGIEIVKKKQIKSKYRDRSRSSEREFSSIQSSPLAPFNLDPEELIANYKPLSQLDVKKKKIDDLDPLAKIMTTKNMRTKVYSGNKSTIYTEVPRLIDICIQTIKDHLEALEYTGGVPFSILEPILKHATPDQLYNLEQFNDYLIEDTGVLWEYHCKKEFRNKVPEKNEPWRNFYIRCLEERETKLAKLRRNINANQAASTPVRKTQLAYVDSTVKPPRGIAKKQAKFQTATADNRRNILNKSMMGENSTAEALSSNKKSTTMATGVPIALTSAHTPSSAMKKKKAPLMQKALQLIKSTRRR
ncbi:transcription elongation factor B polypeptide 3-like [Melanaphis sacchari]|uniref:transcription elongation factor B polypeptide 3-like n=1 Tax=Melanaphis sacchari TaxID=742174 RepID=UPI000DC1308B|nr:transcription elongation factor B polypeptide 3-like [Melanaphis sacchari]